MQKIKLTPVQLETWSAQYSGPRDALSYQDGELHFPDDLADQVTSIDISINPADLKLSEAKKRSRAGIDSQAEAQRLRWITPGEGQALTYQRKVEEAKRAVLEASPAAADYPMLAASVGIDGADVKAVGTLVLAMDAQWAVVGAAIENTRLSAKRDVQTAEDEQAILAIMVSITWPEAPD